MGHVPSGGKERPCGSGTPWLRHSHCSSADRPPVQARQETTVSAGTAALAGAALVSVRTDGPPTAARALKPLQIRDLSLWAGGQNQP